MIQSNFIICDGNKNDYSAVLRVVQRFLCNNGYIQERCKNQFGILEKTSLINNCNEYL